MPLRHVEYASTARHTSVRGLSFGRLPVRVVLPQWAVLTLKKHARTMAAEGANNVARRVALVEFGAPSLGDGSLQRAAGHIWTSSKIRTQFDASGSSKSQQKSSLHKDSRVPY